MAATRDLAPPIAERYGDSDGHVFMTGVQALVRLPVDRHRLDCEAGLHTGTLIAGYPGSPLGGYDLELGRQAALLAAHDIVHRPSVNEELAATAVWGSQTVSTIPGARFDGVVGIWYGKAPGLDRSSDAIRHANLSGVSRSGGALALVGDDPAAKSSTVPSASEASLAALQLPILMPGSVQEVLDLGVHGVALSRSCGLWVAIKVATNVADGFASVQLDRHRVEPTMVGIELDGARYEHEPTMRLIGERLQQLEHSLHYGRLEAARTYARVNGLNRIVQMSPQDRIGIVAAGKTYYDLRQALADLGLSARELEHIGVRLLHVCMPYPLDGDLVREFARGLKQILIVEEKGPFLERLVKDELFNSAPHPLVIGKHDEDGAPLVRADGELDSAAIAEVVGRRLLLLEEVPSVAEHIARLSALPASVPLPTVRVPYFCSGCPHNTSTTSVPDGAVVGAGTGCHGMVMLMDDKQVGTITGTTQMGGEGAQWIGMAPFTERPHIIQNLGDGTFHHSGSLAIRASVAAGVNVNYKLLWNSHVAMTGGQAPVPTLRLDQVARWLLAEGVRRVIITTDDLGRWAGVAFPRGVEIWHRDRILEAQETLAAIEGTTVLVHDQECAAELRRKRKRGMATQPPARVFINERVCEGCGDCGVKSDCLSVHPVETEFGQKTRIHQDSCNQDYSCLKGDCPSFITVIPSKTARRKAPPLAADALPAAPGRRLEDRGFALRVSGIGGTGIVTVAQILGTAGVLDGLDVVGLDQTGLAQKGGPVVSDLKFSATQREWTNKLAKGDCDLHLIADLLVGASRANVEVNDPSRTAAVISTARVPTGPMIIDGSAYPEPDRLLARVLNRCDRGRSLQLDASSIATRLFGTDVVANLLLVGAAYQLGALPVSAESVERAIVINGASVELNLQAFRRGRQAVCDPEGLRRTLESSTSAEGPTRLPSALAHEIAATVQAESDSALARSVLRRVEDLIAYQDSAYAKAYARDVELIRAVEAEQVPGSTALAEAVAFSLHKLLAYKDEYEVGRLHLDPQLRRDIEAQFGAGTTIKWQLHPPLLRAIGVNRKIALGSWFGAGFQTLHRLRGLRGTRLDPFGHTRVRRVERALIAEYRELISRLATTLRPENHALALEIARLPDLIRGYEDVKLRGVERYRMKLAELLPQFDAPATELT